MATTDDRHDESDIDPRWDDPGAYGERRSYHGDGRYPPDWDARREAVMERQRYWCGRCGRYAGDVDEMQVHHLQWLSRGGDNALDNLVALCADCHALMHPTNDGMTGDWRSAPMFPDPDGDPRVAVVRRPVRGRERGTESRHLGLAEVLFDPPAPTAANSNAFTPATYALAPADSHAVAEDLRGRLDDLALPDPAERDVYVRVLTANGSPVGATTVTLDVEGRSLSATTGEGGRARFEIPAGVDTVTASAGDDRRGYGETEIAFHESSARVAGGVVVLGGPDPDAVVAGEVDRSNRGGGRSSGPSAGRGPEPSPGGATAADQRLSTVELALIYGLPLVAGYFGYGYAGLGWAGAAGTALPVFVLLATFFDSLAE